MLQSFSLLSVPRVFSEEDNVQQDKACKKAGEKKKVKVEPKSPEALKAMAAIPHSEFWQIRPPINLFMTRENSDPFLVSIELEIVGSLSVRIE